MKVLHVISGISRKSGGPARSSQGLVAALCKAGVDAWIWPLDGAEPWIEGVRKVSGIVGFKQAARTPLPRSWRLDEFDLVHIHGIWEPRLHKVAAMCRKAGVPYVIAPRGMLEPWSLKQKWFKKWIARWLYQDRDLKLSAALHATAESEAERLRRLGFKNKIIVSPNGVNVPETAVEAKAKGAIERSEIAEGLREQRRANSSVVGRKALAERKVEEWLEGVTRESFCVALEKLVAEKSKTGEYLFEKQEDKEKAIVAAKAFFDGYSRKLVELSDGRCVYFAPDLRSKMRHADISACWAEYAFHAVSSGGDKIPGKNYNYRKYSEYKVVNTDLIEDTLKSERCVPVLRDKPILDSVKFFGSAHLGGLFDVVVRLDECGNANANMTEVTFEASTKRGQKKLPQLVSLAEAIRTVVSHQTATGTYPSDTSIIPNRSPLRTGGRRALFVRRMHPKKGVLELVESWHRVFHSHPSSLIPHPWLCELVYTVSGPEEKAYEQKVKDRILALGMSYKDKDGTIHPSPSPSPFAFIFTGPLDDAEKWTAYARADLFVLPTYSENFGIVVAEALWAGVPVITTKGTPWAELEERKCGWWVELPSAEAKAKGEGEGRRRRAEAKGEEKAWNALDNALREAISLPVTFDCSPLPSPSPLTFTSLQEMGARGHQLVAERYTWAAVCDKMVRGYEAVLKAKAKS